MSTATRVIKNTGFLYIKMAITIVVSLFSTRLILNALGASDFGVYTIVGSSIGMLGFLNYTMANATQRYMSYAEGEGVYSNKLKVFNVSILLHIVIAVLTTLILVIGYFVFFNGMLKIPDDRVFAAKVIYICLVVSANFTILNVPYEAIINAHENMFYYSMVGIVESILKLGIAYLCVFTTSDKLIIYGILISIVPLITLIALSVYCHRNYSECKIAIKDNFDIPLIKEIAFFSGWNFLTAITNLVSNQGIGVVLNRFFGTTLNASHGIAQQVNGQLSAFAANMKKALNPVIVKSAGSKETERMNYLAILGCKYSTLLTVLFAAPLILEMTYVLELWLKNVPEWAVLFCQLQLLITLIIQMSSSLGTSIYAQGDIKYYAINKSIMNLLPIVFTYICFKLGEGPVWLYVPMVVFLGLGGNIIILFYSKKLCHLPVKEYLTMLLWACVTIILVFAAGFVIKSVVTESFVRLVLTTLTTSITLCVFTYFFNLNTDERNYIKNVCFKKARV